MPLPHALIHCLKPRDSPTHFVTRKVGNRRLLVSPALHLVALRNTWFSRCTPPHGARNDLTGSELFAFMTPPRRIQDGFRTPHDCSRLVVH